MDPPWRAPLDVEGVLADIPANAKIAGMFYLALIEGARRRGLSLRISGERYLPFSFYSLSDFTRAMVQAAPKMFPDLSLRMALRRLGNAAPRAFASSTLGRVTLGSAEGVHAAVTAIAKTYEINIRPSRCEILKSSACSMVLALNGVYHFLDSHHVGVFEGTLRHAGVEGSVRIARRSQISADFLLEWPLRSLPKTKF